MSQVLARKTCQGPVASRHTCKQTHPFTHTRTSNGHWPFCFAIICWSTVEQIIRQHQLSPPWRLTITLSLPFRLSLSAIHSYSLSLSFSVSLSLSVCVCLLGQRVTLTCLAGWEQSLITASVRDSPPDQRERRKAGRMEEWKQEWCKIEVEKWREGEIVREKEGENIRVEEEEDSGRVKREGVSSRWTVCFKRQAFFEERESENRKKYRKRNGGSVVKHAVLLAVSFLMLLSWTSQAILGWAGPDQAIWRWGRARPCWAEPCW